MATTRLNVRLSPRAARTEVRGFLGDTLQVRGRAVVAPYAAIGMDVDKPFQYDIVRQRMG